MSVYNSTMCAYANNKSFIDGAIKQNPKTSKYAYAFTVTGKGSQPVKSKIFQRAKSDRALLNKSDPEEKQYPE